MARAPRQIGHKPFDRKRLSMWNSISSEGLLKKREEYAFEILPELLYEANNGNREARRQLAESSQDLIEIERLLRERNVSPGGVSEKAKRQNVLRAIEEAETKLSESENQIEKEILESRLKALKELLSG